MEAVRGPNDSLSVGVCGAPGVYRAGMTTVLRAVSGLDVVLFLGDLVANGLTVLAVVEPPSPVMLVAGDLANSEPRRVAAFP